MGLIGLSNIHCKVLSLEAPLTHPSANCYVPVLQLRLQLLLFSQGLTMQPRLTWDLLHSRLSHPPSLPFFSLLRSQGWAPMPGYSISLELATGRGQDRVRQLIGHPEKAGWWLSNNSLQ